MIAWLKAPFLGAALLAQAAAPSPAPAPALAQPSTPTDDFGPDLKAWLDAVRVQDKDSAGRALAALQRKRAERNLTSVDDVAGAMAGRAEARAAEGASDASELLAAAVEFVPDDASRQARLATLRGRGGDAMAAAETAWRNPFQKGRIQGALVLTGLLFGALLTTGFAFALLLRYSAVFSHDVAEGLPAPLKSLALFMAVLFVALPLAGLLGWGYLPFWWLTLFFIFQSKPEKALSLVLLVGLLLASVGLAGISDQGAREGLTETRHLYEAAHGGTSPEAEAIVRHLSAQNPDSAEWALAGANLARRGGRFDEAKALLAPRAGADPRFSHNLAALELNRFTDDAYAASMPGLKQAAEASLSPRDKATALYNLSLVQANSLAFDQSQDSRKKGDAIDAALLSRFDRLFAFDRNGSKLHAPPDIGPAPERLPGALPVTTETRPADAVSRLTAVAAVLLLIIPVIVRMRGAQSFSKQCPKCGTTFCWLCQTRSTSQEVCSQCHHLFVVKRGIPPAARAAKNAEIARFALRKQLQHRLASLVAPGAGHIAVGDFRFGLPILLLWSLGAAAILGLRVLAPGVVASSPVGSNLLTLASVLAGIAYLSAQALKPKPPAPAPRRVRGEGA